MHSSVSESVDLASSGRAEQLEGEDEDRVRGNALAWLRSVAKLWRDDDLALAPDAHAEGAFLESIDKIASSNDEVRRIAIHPARVEDGAIRQGAGIAHRRVAADDRLRSRPHHDVPVIQARARAREVIEIDPERGIERRPCDGRARR